jgi:hypothetical protein
MEGGIDPEATAPPHAAHEKPSASRRHDSCWEHDLDQLFRGIVVDFDRSDRANFLLKIDAARALAMSTTHAHHDISSAVLVTAGRDTPPQRSSQETEQLEWKMQIQSDAHATLSHELKVPPERLLTPPH